MLLAQVGYVGTDLADYTLQPLKFDACLLLLRLQAANALLVNDGCLSIALHVREQAGLVSRRHVHLQLNLDSFMFLELLLGTR